MTISQQNTIISVADAWTELKYLLVKIKLAPLPKIVPATISCVWALSH